MQSPTTVLALVTAAVLVGLGSAVPPVRGGARSTCDDDSPMSWQGTFTGEMGDAGAGPYERLAGTLRWEFGVSSTGRVIEAAAARAVWLSINVREGASRAGVVTVKERGSGTLEGGYFDRAGFSAASDHMLAWRVPVMRASFSAQMFREGREVGHADAGPPRPFLASTLLFTIEHADCGTITGSFAPLDPEPADGEAATGRDGAPLPLQPIGVGGTFELHPVGDGAGRSQPSGRGDPNRLRRLTIAGEYGGSEIG